MNTKAKRDIAYVFAFAVGLGGYNLLENWNDHNIETAQQNCATVVECQQAIENTANKTRDMFFLGAVGALVLGAGLDRFAGGRRKDSATPKPQPGGGGTGAC